MLFIIYIYIYDNIKRGPRQEAAESNSASNPIPTSALTTTNVATSGSNTINNASVSQQQTPLLQNINSHNTLISNTAPSHTSTQNNASSSTSSLGVDQTVPNSYSTTGSFSSHTNSGNGENILQSIEPDGADDGSRRVSRANRLSHKLFESINDLNLSALHYADGP
ncbi:hypothetical protein ACTFIZ_002970 [Dictyostelium cf. discoideum]